MNPISIMYKTKDERVLKLSMFESDRFFRDLCQRLDCEHLADDPRFIDAAARGVNNAACVAELDAVFGQLTMAEVRERFAALKGAWAPVQNAPEMHLDVQAIANNYLPVIKSDGRRDVAVVAPPIQYDGLGRTELGRCPEHGEHTEEVLLDLGIDWPELSELKDSGVIL